ncbi:MAG: hypothetical protein RLP44_16470 [Aggregatilineales bacterium]
MNKSFRSFIIFSIFAIILIVSAVPLMAQTNDEIGDGSVCFHYDIFTSTGEYISIYLTEEQLINLIYSVPDMEDLIQITTPNSIISDTFIVDPNTIFFVTTPDGIVGAINFDDLGFFADSYGAASWQQANMVTDCLNDGRMNILAQAMLATIYPDGTGGYMIWRVDPTTSRGFFDYQVIYAQIADALALANSTGQPQIIASGETSTLYALINGECQLNSPDAQGIMQEFTFDCGISS